jgi:hypothetical protein
MVGACLALALVVPAVATSIVGERGVAAACVSGLRFYGHGSGPVSSDTSLRPPSNRRQSLAWKADSKP